MESHCPVIGNKYRNYFLISVALKCEFAEIISLSTYDCDFDRNWIYATLWIHGSELLKRARCCTFSFHFCDIEPLRTKPASSALRLPLFRPFRQERGRSLQKWEKMYIYIYENENKRKETHDTPRPRQPRRARANRRQPLNNIPLLLYHIVRAAW